MILGVGQSPSIKDKTSKGNVPRCLLVLLVRVLRPARRRRRSGLVQTEGSRGETREPRAANLIQAGNHSRWPQTSSALQCRLELCTCG